MDAGDMETCRGRRCRGRIQECFSVIWHPHPVGDGVLMNGHSIIGNCTTTNPMHITDPLRKFDNEKISSEGNPQTTAGQISGIAGSLHEEVSFCPSSPPSQTTETDVDDHPCFDVEAPPCEGGSDHVVQRAAGPICCRDVEKTNMDTGSYTRPLGMSLEFLDVEYRVLSHQSSWGSKCGRGRQILQGITGFVAPGEMLALMGPSGSGKTTLLNMLASRLVNDFSYNTTGVITYNGSPFGTFMKRRMGFVTQDDILYPHLTVKETLNYAALLRLPAWITRKEKTERAEQVIRQLGLEMCQNTVIGNTFLRGVSGGERKRVCIGHEILIDPALIFLDEPTSGLDSTTALRIVQLLRTLAQNGHTVVTTIHQPSSRLFHMFDKLLLLAEGRSVYFGEAQDAMLHFGCIGFTPIITMNPADFLLDLCSGNVSDMEVPAVLEMRALERYKEEQLRSVRGDGNRVIPTAIDVLQYLAECNESKLGNKEAAAGRRESLGSGDEEERTWAASWAEQVAVLLERGLRERRHDYLNWLKVAQIMAVAVLCGSLWWRSTAETPTGLRDQVGLLFFVAIFWGFFPLFNAIFTFPLERTMLAKERASDMYRLSAYFIARSVSDLPLDLLLPSLFMALVYFMATLRMSVAAFTFTMFAVYLTVITSQAAGLLIGAVLMDVQKATTFGSVLIIAFMLSGGYFVHHIPRSLAWIKFLSFQSHCYGLLVIIQYGPFYGIKNCFLDGGSSSVMTHSTLTDECQKSLELTKALHGMPPTSAAQEVWSLVAISVVCRVFAYMALRSVKVGRSWLKLQRYAAVIRTKEVKRQKSVCEKTGF